MKFVREHWAWIVLPLVLVAAAVLLVWNFGAASERTDVYTLF